jgi:hypothetical protein
VSPTKTTARTTTHKRPTKSQAAKATATVTKTRTRRLPELLDFLHSRKGTWVHVNEMARELGMEPGEVRSSLHGYLKRNTYLPITEPERYVYVWGSSTTITLPDVPDLDADAMTDALVTEDALAEADIQLSPSIALHPRTAFSADAPEYELVNRMVFLSRTNHGTYLLQDSADKSVWELTQITMGV